MDSKGSRGMGLIVYGTEGIGKTSFAMQFPHPLRCISVNETGYEDLDDIDMIPEDCENEYVDSYDELINEIRNSRDVKTIVVDSLSGVAQLMKDAIIQDCYGDAQNPLTAFASFSEGWRIHAPIYMERLETVGSLARSKGINIIFIGHTKIEKGKTIVANDYQTAMINLESWPRDVILKWAQACLFMTMDFKVRATKLWKGKPTESKVIDKLGEEVDRVLYTTKHPSHSAKNRLNLPPEIEMGASAEEAYTNFVEACPSKIQEHLNQ